MLVRVDNLRRLVILGNLCVNAIPPNKVVLAGLPCRHLMSVTKFSCKDACQDFLSRTVSHRYWLHGEWKNLDDMKQYLCVRQNENPVSPFSVRRT